MLAIDLNADLGEGITDDDALLAVVTSANVACGVHAGDDPTMRRVCAIAAELGVVIGAQVSYDDRENFGRVPMDVPSPTLARLVADQIDALAAHASAAGTTVSYVKPHGALYNRAVADEEQARAIVDGILVSDAAATAAEDGLMVLSLPGSALARAAQRAGLMAVAEAFADRAYTSRATLVPRAEAGAVITDSATVVTRSVRIATGEPIEDADGSPLTIAARSLCVHGDTPGAATLAARVRRALAEAGIAVVPFAVGSA